MKKSDINPMPEYFDRYINLVSDVELSQAFDESIEQIEKFDVESLRGVGDRVYAPGKWTVKTIIQHLTDFERILGYRALLFARKDTNPRQGVDEQMLAINAKAEGRALEELIAELKSVRFATKSLFSGFDDEMRLNTGVNWKYEISVLAMGFNIIGHQTHHFRVIQERYFPLIEKSQASNSAV